MSRPVTVIGLMGAGKTKVGRGAAARLDRPFVDTDLLVEQAAGRPVAEIFATEGEPAFRAREREAVAEALATDGAIVSVGGGAVLDPGNVERIRAAGSVVWLHADPAELARRLRRSLLRGDRPLLADGDPEAVLRRLLDDRGDAYRAAATVVLRTDGLEVEESTQLLVTWIREHP
jgi:shikimate kinase